MYYMRVVSWHETVAPATKGALKAKWGPYANLAFKTKSTRPNHHICSFLRCRFSSFKHNFLTSSVKTVFL